MTHYVAVFHQTDKGEYGVSFPDFPGCVSAGRGFDDALLNATEALAMHVEGMKEDGVEIPLPSDIAPIRDGKIGWVDLEGAALAFVPLVPAAGETLRIQVTMDSRLLSQIDAVSRNRSAFLAEAVRRALA
jgi:predicted RNase H-like HicB family nuclease